MCQDTLGWEDVRNHNCPEWAEAWLLYGTSTSFNLFTCAVMERWLERVHEVDEEAGVKLLYKFYGKLFR